MLAKCSKPLIHKPCSQPNDMCKAADRAMTITDVRLREKHGGKSGSFLNP